MEYGFRVTYAGVPSFSCFGISEHGHILTFLASTVEGPSRPTPLPIAVCQSELKMGMASALSKVATSVSERLSPSPTNAGLPLLRQCPRTEDLTIYIRHQTRVASISSNLSLQMRICTYIEVGRLLHL